MTSLILSLPLSTGSGQADDCTSGFMSLGRMNKVLDNYIVSAPSNRQAIIPEIMFTCNGTITTWIFGGQWNGQIVASASPELQIWRSNGNGSYNRVGSTEINVTESNTTRLYWYHLSPNLTFQEGDILGFYQPQSSESPLRLRLAVRMDPLQTVYLRLGNQDTEFATTCSSCKRMLNVLVNVETGKCNIRLFSTQNNADIFIHSTLYM